MTSREEEKDNLGRLLAVGEEEEEDLCKYNLERVSLWEPLALCVQGVFFRLAEGVEDGVSRCGSAASNCCCFWWHAGDSK